MHIRNTMDPQEQCIIDELELKQMATILRSYGSWQQDKHGKKVNKRKRKWNHSVLRASIKLSRLNKKETVKLLYLRKLKKIKFATQKLVLTFNIKLVSVGLEIWIWEGLVLWVIGSCHVSPLHATNVVKGEGNYTFSLSLSQELPERKMALVFLWPPLRVWIRNCSSPGLGANHG